MTKRNLCHAVIEFWCCDDESDVITPQADCRFFKPFCEGSRACLFGYFSTCLCPEARAEAMKEVRNGEAKA